MYKKEIWTSIDGYENYLVSDMGRIKNRKTGKLLKDRATTKGYRQIGICKDGKQKNFLVHRLVAEAHVPNPYNLPEVNHKKGRKWDNRASELEWTTRSGNMKHACILGLRDNICTHSCTKKTRCPELGQVFESAYDASRQTGVNRGHISSCCSGRRESAGKHPESGQKLTWKFVAGKNWEP